jgi:hypothetical protein
MRSVRSLTFGASLVLALWLSACTTTGKSYIPVDSPLRPWQGPEQSEPSVQPAPAPSSTTPSSAPASAAPQAEKGEKKGKK